MSQGGSAISVAPSAVDGGSVANRRQFRWVQRGVSFSGRERHCCFLNTKGQQFADISTVAGLDFDDDGRAVGRVDWDRDGDIDFWITNRNGPQLRLLRNDVPQDHHFVALRLEGRTSNRDAIGARIELTVAGTPPSTQIQTLRAGDGYLAQSSKWIHFGLGESTEIQRVVVRWPGGNAEEIRGIGPDGRYRIVQGTGRAEPWDALEQVQTLKPVELTVPASSEQAHIVLSSPIPLPQLPYTTFDGGRAEVSSELQRPVLVNLWASWCQPCIAELESFAKNASRLAAHMDVVVLSVDGLGGDRDDERAAQAILHNLQLPFTTGLASQELLEKLQLVDHLLFDVHLQMPVPTSILIDREGQLAAIYKGPVSVGRLLEDVKKIRADPESRRHDSLPFAGRWYEQRMSARLLPLAWDLIKQGYLDDGLEYLSKNDAWLRSDPEYAKLLALTGYELLERGDMEQAELQYRAAIQVDPTTTVAHLNMAVTLIRQGKHAEAVAQYHEALRYQPNDPRVFYSLAWLLATASNPTVRDGEEAVRWAERAANATRFQNAPALEALAAAYAEAGRFDQAVASARRALQLARLANDPHVITRIESRLQLYENGQPYHEPASQQP